MWLFSSMMFYLLCRICCMFRIGPFPPLRALRQVSHSPESGRLISSFRRGHILSRAGATALEGPFFDMLNSMLSILHKIKRLNYVEFIQLLYIMSQSGYQRFFQRSNGASPLVFLHIQKKARDSLRCPVPFPFLRKKRPLRYQRPALRLFTFQ